MSKIKIGILINDINSLASYQLLIIHKILSNPDLELALLIRDGRDGADNPASLKNRLHRLLKKKSILGILLLKFQVLLEKSFFRPHIQIDRKDLLKNIDSIPSVFLKPKSQGFLDIFSNNDANTIKAYELDIILRNGFNIIRGEILNSAKYGIWSFHHGDNSINRGMPAAFWEVLFNQPSVGVTLQQLIAELDGGLVIDKAYYNTHWSFFKTQNIVLESSVSLLFKNLRQLKNRNYDPKKSPAYYNPLYTTPDFVSTIKYLFMFYQKVYTILVEKLNYLLFGTRYNCWSLFIGKGNFLESTMYRLKPVKMPKNEFWADPFIIEHNDDNYIFFENYSYESKIGKISCGKIKGNQLIDIKDVLDLDYHLSFPFVFEFDDDIFMIPETSAKKRLEVYKCKNFPDEWDLYSTAFEGESLVDATVYKDEQNQNWLFVNKKSGENCTTNDELFIYRFDDLNFNNIESHTKNPVIIDSKKARNAGEIFKYKGSYFRPSQASMYGVYGFALNINKIVKLTIDEYEEETAITTFGNFKKGLKRMHHLHQRDNLFVIDAAYKKM
ncbi:hypothetical protein N8376_06105 [Flavobacteriaceae bacterium]|nr:hypothetical protein [Flavobacteriaceae bacterium]MDC1492909.1 hypothetical protein [Flavobacteriaceae bacterium]